VNTAKQAITEKREKHTRLIFIIITSPSYFNSTGVVDCFTLWPSEERADGANTTRNIIQQIAQV
jgi:hypothetical protein